MSGAALRTPDPPDMEARLGRLEADTQDIKAILARLEPVLTRIDTTQQKHGQDILKIMVDVAELKGRVSQLPSTVQLLGFVLAVLAITGVLHVFVR